MPGLLSHRLHPIRLPAGFSDPLPVAMSELALAECSHSEVSAAPAPCWSVYMLRYGSGRLYTGISTDVQRRLAEHQAGKGARALRGRGPLQLVWQLSVGEQSLALRLEYRLKQWPKARKEALLLGQVPLPELTP
jgi:putative endonuclease